MTYGYYPGCSLEGISLEYDHSIRSLFNALKVDFKDLPDWICCGTLAAPSMSRLLGVATPMWNVARTGQLGFEQLIAPCSACVYHFKNAAQQVAGNNALRKEVEAIVEMPLDKVATSVHPLEILVNDGFENRIKSAIRRDISELKAVCYYGCHISRPANIMQFDDPEYPESMDRVLSWVGVDALEWAGKVDCCGAHFSMIKPEIAVDLCAKLVESALEVGADALIVACPMCHANMDARQEQIAVKLGISLNLPILYFSQVIGYALGIEPKLLGFKKHLVDPLPLMLSRCKQRNTPESIAEVIV